MNRAIWLLAALWAQPVGTALALEKYICIAEQTTGFWWNATTKAWEQAKFKGGDKWLIEELVPTKVLSRTFNYQVKKFGQDVAQHLCERPLIGNERVTRIMCGGLPYGLMMDTKTLRYQEFYSHGYVDGGDSTANTPAVTIGTCTKLE